MIIDFTRVPVLAEPTITAIASSEGEVRESKDSRGAGKPFSTSTKNERTT